MEQDIRKRSCARNNKNKSFFNTKFSILNSNLDSQLSKNSQETRRIIAEHNSTKMIRLALLAAALAILTSLLIGSVGAQSTKGGQASGSTYSSGRPTSSVTAPSPVAQLRQQQQNYAPAAAQTSRQSSAGGTKRRPQQQQQQSTYAPVTQQQQTGGYQQQQQQQQQQQETATEDPLADSEPALYGSVAGQPGVDFPAYTRIPKTSFTCEGKGFDFGFYADEEAQCQVYHVCWSGRRESFLCGVGTVFNQAILACDYWHSVDCSKTSQFYGVNSELGKSNSEPASGSQRQPARNSVTLPPANAPTSGANYGDNTNQNKRNQQQQPPQQQQYNINDDSNFDLPLQQQQVTNEIPQSPVQVGSYRASPPPQQQQQQLAGYGSTSAQSAPTFTPQRSQPQSYEYQQRLVHSNEPGRTKSNANQPPRQQPAVSPPPPAAPSQQQAATKQRPRFNMDFNQKVNSLIESPIRAPLKSSISPAANYANTKQQRAQQEQQQQQVGRNQRPANFAQLAVSRAQQAGSQQLNLGPARKGGYQQQAQYQQQQQQQTPDNDIEEPQQQQQQNFDDSPVQTSTVQTTPAYGSTSRSQSNGGFVPQQTVIQAGNGLDGASAITTQYDTLTPAGVSGQSAGSNQQSGSSSSNSDQSPSYESSLEEANSSANDDFRSSGAKAAASHNQNWYIMKSI